MFSFRYVLSLLHLGALNHYYNKHTRFINLTKTLFLFDFDNITVIVQHTFCL